VDRIRSSSGELPPTLPQAQTLDQEREQLAGRVRRILEMARRHSGTPVASFAEKFGHLQSRGGKGRTAWYEWQSKPERASSLTLLAALRLLAPEAALEVIFGQTGNEEGVASSYLTGDFVTRNDHEDIRRELEKTEDDLAHLGQQVRYLGKVIEELAGSRRMAEISRRLGGPMGSDLERLAERVRGPAATEESSPG
jgi:hypothetical protein